VLPGYRPVAEAIYGVYPHTRHPSRKVLAIITHLREVLASPPWEGNLTSDTALVSEKTEDPPRGRR
jgi:hypothetical protein